MALVRPLPPLRLTRAAWLAVGVSALALAVALASPWILLAWLLPDLAVLAGGPRIADADGRMRPAAIRGYNATHVLAGPAAVAVVGALAAPALLAVAALWLSHLGIDRAIGYWPRDADGRPRHG